MAVVFTPARFHAQQAAPAANAAPVSAPDNAIKPPTAATEAATEVTPKSEEEELNVYRHASIVQTLAKLFHLPLETTARIFEGINFAILALCIGIPLVRFLPKVVRKRSQTLKHNIEEARKVTEDAQARLSAIETKLAGLGTEIQKFRSEVEQEIGQDEVRIKAALESESARIVAAAEQEIGVAAAQARRGLQHFAADLAIQQAAKQLVLTPETDRKLIAEFTAGLGLNGTEKGGRK